MTSTEYLSSMKKRLSAHYDVYDQHDPAKMQADLYAHYYARNEKYFATKSATLYAYESNEHTFFKQLTPVTTEDIDAMISLLKASIDTLVDPHDEHMSTRLNAVIITEQELTPAVKRYIETFKFQKAFLFGLKGWVDICIIAVNLENGSVTASKKARKSAGHYSPLPLQ